MTGRVANTESRSAAVKRMMVLLAAGGAFVPQTAWAQAAPAAAQETAAIEDIIVTGQKRAENVQDIPKSVTVASQALLTSQGVSRLIDLPTIFPSLTVTANYMNTKPPGIRGIVTFSSGVGVQTLTGIIVDDIPQPTFSSLANELTDIERVEVFAGPQSTLSGRNAAGGLINFVTRGPEFKFGADVRFEQTFDHQTKASAFVTGPVSDKIAFSLSAYTNKWRGWAHNILLDNYAAGFNAKGVRGKLLFNVTDNFKALVTGYYVENKRTTTPVIGGGVYVDVAPGATHASDALAVKRTFSQLYPGVNATGGNKDFYSFENGTARTKDRGVSLRLDYDMGDVGSITSLSNYQRSNQPRTDVFLGSPRTNVVPTITGFNATTDVSTKYWSQELRLASKGNQPFTYLLGAIYTDADLFQPYARRLILPFDSDRTFRIQSVGLFGRATYELTPRDSITGGLRYQWDKIGYTWVFKLAPVGAYSAASSKYDFFAGEASFKHDFSDRVNAYVTLSRSETGESYDTEDNTNAALRPLVPLKSAKVKNVEFGVKSQFFDNRLTLNLNLYRADYSNYQVSTVDSSNPNVAPVIRLLAIGRVRTQGVELVSSLRASDRLRLGATASFNDARIRDYAQAACYTRQTVAQGCQPATATAPANQGNLKGGRLQSAPKLRLNTTVDYKIPLEAANAEVNLGGAFRYESSSNFAILQDPLVRQRGFGQFDARIGLTRAGGQYGIELFVNNIFDTHYYAELRNESQINARSAYYARNSFRYGGVRLNAKF